MKTPYFLVIVLLLGLSVTTAHGEKQIPESQKSGIEIMEKSQQAFYYPGKDMKSEIRMELITADGKKRLRVLTMLRWNDPKSKDQKYFLYFREPADVRGMTFMVWEYPARESDRWIYVPAIDLVRRIAANDARSSFVGSDFTYEDVSGRNIASDTHTLLREEKLGERDCYVVESLPKEPIEYVRRISWIDKTTYLPLKEEYYDVQKELARTFSADKIEEVSVAGGKDGESYPTVIRRTMKNLKSGHRTEVTLTPVSYNVGLQDDLFTERYLRNPPERWIK
ncbi:MAG: outer membrane lipoprotein-sorting protein [Candidatus Tectomicrobia bacterium]|uniref:Outer membrane lipoprotein-sorting protein n=1 Tax=Tectimicrobiota bacterium TaxID=2528274 RepID=A0A933GKA5_UNCTE|nr:outer membrane lipoprotein-sorting protein [Candidatus Tectomicrobia bacterium]